MGRAPKYPVEELKWVVAVMFCVFMNSPPFRDMPTLKKKEYLDRWHSICVICFLISYPKLEIEKHTEEYLSDLITYAMKKLHCPLDIQWESIDIDEINTEYVSVKVDEYPGLISLPFFTKPPSFTEMLAGLDKPKERLLKYERFYEEMKKEFTPYTWPFRSDDEQAVIDYYELN